MSQVKASLDAILEEARQLNAEDFLQASKAQENAVTNALCALYREGKNREAVKSLSLKSIIINGMDDEQIFQQMKVLEEPIVDHIERMTKALDDNVTEEDQLVWASEVKKTMFPDSVATEKEKSKKNKTSELKSKKDKKKTKPSDDEDDDEFDDDDDKKKKKEKKKKSKDDELSGDHIMYKDFFGDAGLDDDEELNRMLIDDEKQQELEDLLDQHDSDIDLNADIDSDVDDDDDEPLEVVDEDNFDDSIFEPKPEKESDEEEEDDDEEDNDEEEEEDMDDD